MFDRRGRYTKPIIAACALLMFVLAGRRLPAQPVLTLEAAIEEAMRASPLLQGAATGLAIARNNVTPGAAGYLPKLDLNASYAGSITDSRQTLSSGAVTERTGASATNANAGIVATWTVFDGFRMFGRKEQFERERDAAELEFESAQQLLRRRVIDAYYGVAVRQRIVAIADSALAISQERQRIAGLKHAAGEYSAQELLQARVDLNADRSARLRADLELRNAGTALNVLLARAESEVRVSGTIEPRTGLVFEQLLDSALLLNPELRRLRLERDLADVERRLVDADRYPRVGVSLGYTLQSTTNDASLIAGNRTAGPNYGVSLSMNLYDGSNTDRLAANARMRITAVDFAIADAEARLRAALRSAFDRYTNRMELVALERENAGIARENLELAGERFRAGAIIALELREAQNAFVEAEGRATNALYETKLAETELLYLSGALR